MKVPIIKCEVCGEEVVQGYVAGMTPSPMKFKLGLCEKHDTPQNRQRLENIWRTMMVSETRMALQTTKRKESSKTPTRFELTIHFLDGGVVRVPCKSYEVNDNKDLLILNENDEIIFYPLMHVKSFTARELAKL